MSLSEKIKGVKKGLAVLVAGAMISGIAYAKEINNEGWPLPDETKYYQMLEPKIEEVPCEYEGKTINIEVKVESYASIPGIEDTSEKKMYTKSSFEDQTFMYVIIESEGTGDAYNLTVIMDRDGNGSMETKYEGADIEGLEEEGVIPKWVVDKAVKKLKETETN